MFSISRILLFNPDEPLLFTRLFFWVFLFVVLFIYSIVYKDKVVRNIFLLIASLFFYYKTSGFFFLLLIVSTCTDYFLGNALFKTKKDLSRKWLLAASLIINLGVLGYFKYAYFLADSFNAVFNANIQVIDYIAMLSNNVFGSRYDISRIILPVGISFYTFQTISYTFDIYRKKISPVGNILDFGFYVSFFPQLVAGPIVRASEFIPQIYKKYSLNRNEFGFAVFMILNGLIKKLVVGDYLAVQFIDRIFANPLSYSGFENLMALYGYSIQVYCDFSGYTDIATGVALFFGFQLPVNFNSPYKAQNVGDFWKRWHISLSSWLRDYLYIPLGGNRNGRLMIQVNIMLTMLLGGLWHGANWNFVFWGGINGIGLLVYKGWKKISPYEKMNTWYINAWRIFLTFNFITFTRIFFRGEDMRRIFEMMHQIVNDFNWKIVPMVLSSYKMVFIVMALAYIIHWLPSGVKGNYKDWFIGTSVIAKAAIAVGVIFILYQSVSSELQPFIYFQF